MGKPNESSPNVSSHDDVLDESGPRNPQAIDDQTADPATESEEADRLTQMQHGDWSIGGPSPERGSDHAQPNEQRGLPVGPEGGEYE